ncbi:MAG: hypothetical protein KKH99_03020 [Proteobacteria bacterium]|nr:hypothetical protein [Pseudomonadota bacterium]
MIFRIAIYLVVLLFSAQPGFAGQDKACSLKKLNAALNSGIFSAAVYLV